MCVPSSIKMTDALRSISECFQLHKKINQPCLFKKIIIYTNCIVSAFLSWHISTSLLKSAYVCMRVDLDFIVSSLCTLDTWCGGGRELGQNSSVLFLVLSLAFEKLVCLSDLLLFSLDVAVCFSGLQKKGGQDQREPGMEVWGYEHYRYFLNKRL